MAMTKIWMTQYARLEERLVVRDEVLTVNQIADPENIKKYLCSDPNRDRCYIKFSNIERELYCACALKKNYETNDLVEMYINKFPYYGQTFVWYNDHLHKYKYTVVSMPKRGVCICSHNEELVVKYRRISVSDLLSGNFTRIK